MSLSLILGGTALLLGASSTRSANKAADAANEMNQYQSLLSAEKQAFQNTAQQYNITKEFGNMVASQQALASSMGKQATGGSIDAIRREDYSNLQRDINLLDKSTEFARRSAQIGISAGDVATSAQKRARNTGFLSRGLLTAGMMFA
jgi:hypothetical protein